MCNLQIETIFWSLLLVYLDQERERERAVLNRIMLQEKFDKYVHVSSRPCQDQECHPHVCLSDKSAGIQWHLGLLPDSRLPAQEDPYAGPH